MAKLALAKYVNFGISYSLISIIFSLIHQKQTKVKLFLGSSDRKRGLYFGILESFTLGKTTCQDFFNVGLTPEKERQFERRYYDIFLKKLLETNLDFKKTFEENFSTANPIIKICQFSSGSFTVKLKTKQSFIYKNSIT